MAWKSNADRYGTVAVAIHWASAAAIAVLLGSGFLAADLIDEAAKVPLLRVHVVTGLAVVALTMFRLGWWLWADRRPNEPPGLGRYQALASRLVHRLFYLVIVVLGASGIAMVAMSGAGAVLFGSETALPDFTEYPPRAVHGLAGRLLLVLAAVHVAAAFYHQFVRRDGTLTRMLP